MALSLAPLPGPGGPKQSSLACCGCRQRRLKCSGNKPSCARCTREGDSCTYTPSLRGRAPRKGRHGSVVNTSSYAPYNSTPQGIPFEVGSNHAPFHLASQSMSQNVAASYTRGSSQRSASESRAPALGVMHRTNGWATSQPHQPFMPSSTTDGSPITDTDDPEGYTDLYYDIFHPYHPFLAPRAYFAVQGYPVYLKLVIQLIGSHYATTGTNNNLREQATAAVDADGTYDVHKVRALILLGIALHARFEPHEAQAYAKKAVSVAVDIGLNKPEFATGYAHFGSMLVESLRRTWWEVYVVDGYIGALHQDKTFDSNMVSSHALLPCEESDYEKAVCSQEIRSLERFEKRQITDDESVYSSFCYRIEAIRILARVMGVIGQTDVSIKEINNVDGAISSWEYHVPEGKMRSINKCSNYDPLVHQAQLFIHYARILLNFPRSRLPLDLPMASNIECVRPVPKSCLSPQEHAERAISAAEKLNNLASSVPGRNIEHASPFFICGLVQGGVVQLSSFSLHSGPSGGCNPKCLQNHEDQVKLTIASLTAHSRHWGIATHVLQRIRSIAAGVFNPKDLPNPPTPSPSLDGSLTAESAAYYTGNWTERFYNNVSRRQPQDVTSFSIS